ncbi:MAG: hypothetical protein QGI83_09970, partial [Candidatus Latescibacteria bacterium]|nr:hypothetical protein [Candidatus Latescibacterota bacterium]
ETGHGCRSPEIFEEVVPWLVRQRKERSPDRVVHATFTLRHNRSYWAAIEQLDAYDGRASVDCEVMDENRIEVRTENVRTFQLSNPESRKISDVVIDGSSVADVNLDRGVLFQKGERGEWERGSFDLSAEKRRGASGPIGDMFHDGVLLVPGTSGTGYHTHVTQDCAQRAVGFYRERNGGVHRGGIMGSNDVRLRVVNDSDLTEADLKQYNLLLLGTPRSNSVLSRLRDRLPIAFEGDAIRICDRTYTAEGAAVFAVFPHPENPDRYVAVHGGDAPDAICWGSHLDMHLLPDYLVYARESVIDWGFWDNRWRAPA